jgi:ABC-type cobalamin/Fe3+-siderophores transport system ATPase subunit
LTDALAAERIDFDYPGRPFFRGLSLALAEGELAGLIGPNGSGKTTLLRILSGVLRPGSGRVLLQGKDLEALPPRSRAQILAVVPQESRTLFDYTVLEVALMGRFAHLGLLGMESREDVEIAQRCLAEVGMERAASRSLNELSSGERQRVYIARALTQQPGVLLLDEPTSFLDLKHRLQTYEILARLNRERGLTVLAISHDLNLAARYCRRLHLIRDGAIAASGSPAEVITGASIREVYGTDAEIGKDPRTGAPFVIPYPSSSQGGIS